LSEHCREHSSWAKDDPDTRIAPSARKRCHREKERRRVTFMF
jgi:hypothetical protein